MFDIQGVQCCKIRPLVVWCYNIRPLVVRSSVIRSLAVVPSFGVHHPVYWDDWHLLANAMASDFSVAWQFLSKRFFVTDQTPRPYPTRTLPAQFNLVIVNFEQFIENYRRSPGYKLLFTQIKWCINFEQKMDLATCWAIKKKHLVTMLVLL
jgi:hypothetical protein